MTREECICLYQRNLDTRKRVLKRVDSKLEGKVSIKKLKEINNLFRLHEALAREGSEYFNVLCK